MVTMEKPMAVMTKVTGESNAMDTSIDGADISPSPSQDTCYLVKAIVRKKLLFKTRPKPIIAHVPKKI